MHICIERGHKEIISYILNIEDIQNQCNLNVRDKNGRTILHLSVIKGYSSIVEKLISLGVSVHELDNFQWTPLHYASLYSRDDIVKMLLNKGANVNAQNKDGWTCTHSCSLQGHYNTLKILLEDYGAHMNLKTYNGYTPLHFAVINEHEECIKLLLENDADTQAIDFKKATPFEYAMSKNISSLLNRKNSKILTDPKKCRLINYNNNNIYVGDDIKFTIQAYDQWNRKRSRGGDNLLVVVRKENQELQIPGHDNGKGLYFFNYKATDIGIYHFDFLMNNESIKNKSIKVIVRGHEDDLSKQELKYLSTPLLELNRKKIHDNNLSSLSSHIISSENTKFLDSMDDDNSLNSMPTNNIDEQSTTPEYDDTVDSLKRQIHSYEHQISLLKDELMKEKERNSCKNCGLPKDCIIVPCYHFIYCKECIESNSSCLSCGERIVEVLNIKI